MNGVPNSPINRYHQVEDSLIENNSLINVDHIQLAAGSDTERSAAPLRTEFKNNLVYNADKRDPFTIYDDISGISFTGNVINDAKGFQIPVGFKNKSFALKSNESGLMEPKAGDAGISSNLPPIEKQQLGPNWYPKPEATAVFDQGKTISVEPGLDTISRALNQAGNSDILSLAGGAYTVSRVLLLDKAITLKATSKSPNAVVSYERATGTLWSR